ncbi:MAG: hypothetical protein U1G05_14190 [Kiritimatiellia bacterium]
MTCSHSEHRYRRIGWGAASGWARFAAILFGMWTVPLLVAYLGRTDYGVPWWDRAWWRGGSRCWTWRRRQPGATTSPRRRDAMTMSAPARWSCPPGCVSVVGLLGFPGVPADSRPACSGGLPQATAREAWLILQTVQYSGMDVLPGASPATDALDPARPPVVPLCERHLVAGSLTGFVFVWAGIHLRLSLAAIATLQAASFAIPTLPLWVAAARRHPAAPSDPAGPRVGFSFALQAQRADVHVPAWRTDHQRERAFPHLPAVRVRDPADYGLAMRVYGLVFLGGVRAAAVLPGPPRGARARPPHLGASRPAAPSLFLVRLAVIGLSGILLLAWGDTILELWSGQPLKHPLA